MILSYAGSVVPTAMYFRVAVTTSSVRKNSWRLTRDSVSSPLRGLERPPGGTAHHQTLSLCKVSPTDGFGSGLFRSLLVARASGTSECLPPLSATECSSPTLII
jgi:hypothetical protein